jgi:hypothetical protein
LPDGLPEVPAEMMESVGNAVEGITPEPAPVDPTNQVTPETTATPEGEAQEAATEAPDSFTKLDPNALPEEVQPYYKSMLADYTRKQQEAAPWRKLGEELGVDSPDAIKEAAELYAYLQDPNNLHSLYQQLDGMFNGQQAAAQAAPLPAATPFSGSEEELAALENPDVAELKAQMQALTGYIQEREAAQQQEALQWQLLGEMNRQEALLKEQHPDWGEEEWNALWNTSVAFDGDLVQAAGAIEAAQQAAVTRLLNGKAQAAETPGLTAPLHSHEGAAVQERDYSDPELRDLTKEAVAFVQGFVNTSE